MKEAKGLGLRPHHRASDRPSQKDVLFSMPDVAVSASSSSIAGVGVVASSEGDRCMRVGEGPASASDTTPMASLSMDANAPCASLLVDEESSLDMVGSDVAAELVANLDEEDIEAVAICHDLLRSGDCHGKDDYGDTSGPVESRCDAALGGDETCDMGGLAENVEAS